MFFAPPRYWRNPNANSLLCVRTYSVPSTAAGVAKVPSPMSLTASIFGLGPELNTVMVPFPAVQNNLPSAMIGEA